jgi:hypothetical protein
MTVKRLAVALTAFATVVGLCIPALAGARAGSGRRVSERQLEIRPRRSSSPVGCKLNLIAEPRTVTGGETPQLFGRLHCPATTAEAGQTVTLYGHSAGEANKAIGTTTTDSGGYYTMVAPAPQTDTVYFATALGATSPTKTVKVSPAVTIHGPNESATLLTGFPSRATFSGTVSPVDAGAEVVLQREQAVANEEWHRIQRGVVGPHGEYTFVHVFVIPGDANIRVVVRPHRRFSAFGASTPLSYVISQRQNPRLTLLATGSGASSDPILYAQTVTLHGVLAGGGGQTMTLLARPEKGQFTAVATTKAGPGGQYSFAQAPQQNTAYKVLGGGRHSAVLFEGVKYTLTAGVSAGTVQAGQTLTFSGTVTPFREGHAVYLERQNANGGGFHVVDLGTLTPGPGISGSYSITHVFFGMGKQVLRIKVPGDPLNEGVASAPFTIEVTPSPAAALRLFPPERLPGEGQN